MPHLSSPLLVQSPTQDPIPYMYSSTLPGLSRDRCRRWAPPTKPSSSFTKAAAPVEANDPTCMMQGLANHLCCRPPTSNKPQTQLLGTRDAEEPKDHRYGSDATIISGWSTLALDLL